MENSEDMIKINKMLVTTKRGSYDQFFTKINFSEPRGAEELSRVLILVAGLFTYPVPDISSDVNNRNMIRNMAEISTRKHNSNGALYVLF